MKLNCINLCRKLNTSIQRSLLNLKQLEIKSSHSDIRKHDTDWFGQTNIGYLEQLEFCLATNAISRSLDFRCGPKRSIKLSTDSSGTLNAHNLKAVKCTMLDTNDLLKIERQARNLRHLNYSTGVRKDKLDTNRPNVRFPPEKMDSHFSFNLPCWQRLMSKSLL